MVKRNGVRLNSTPVGETLWSFDTSKANEMASIKRYIRINIPVILSMIFAVWFFP
jgi:hypothetical protein